MQSYDDYRSRQRKTAKSVAFLMDKAVKTGQNGEKWRKNCPKRHIYGSSRTVALRAAWAPITSTWAMSAVFEGPLMNVP